MAHANIFEKVNKNVKTMAKPRTSKETSPLDTIKALGEQILGLQGIIEEQHLVIQDLAQSVSDLKTSQKETKEDLKLAFIDQKDIVKQLRIVKSDIHTNEYVQVREHQQQFQTQPPVETTSQAEQQEIEELFFSNAPQSEVMKNHHAGNAIKMALNELKKLEKPKRKFLAKKSVEEKKENSRLSNDELAKRMIFGKTPKIIR